MKFYLTAFLTLLFVFESATQTIVRGPYLQMGTPSSMIIRWRTNTATSSKIWYGNNPSNLSSTLSQTEPRTEHEINITDLSPNTTYYYAVGNEAGQIVGADNEHYFTTSPTHGDSKPVSIWVLGDAGKRTASQRSVRDAFYDFNGGPHTDLILLLGDNAYDSGTDQEYQEAWFENMYESSLINSVVWPSVGNHDILSADSDNESGPYYDIFNCPRNGEAGGLASGTEAYYSFNYANIHFIALNTEDVDQSLDSPMLAWLQEDLAANTQEWIVAFFHKQPYYTVPDIRTNFVPVLEAAGVDLVLYGHRHIYRRSILMNGHYGSEGTFDPATMAVNAGDGRADGDGVYEKPPGNAPNAGTVYLVSGSAGSSSSINTYYPFTAFEQGDPEKGSTYISVNGSQMDVQFVNDQGVVRDYFTISKGVGTRPQVSISSPVDGAAYSSLQTINITADASDPDGQISQVEFFANNASIGTDYSAPFSLNWAVPTENIYELKAIATDNDGNFSQSAPVTIEVGIFSACASITNSSDDVEQPIGTGGMKHNSSDLELGVDAAAQLVGLRFQNLGLPKNAQIVSAELQFTVDEANNVNPCVLNVYGEASGNSAPFTLTDNDLANRPRTQSSIAWTPNDWNQVGLSGPDQQADIRAVIQEVVNQSAYTANSAISIIIEGSGKRVAQAFDKNPAAAPRLCVVYQFNDSGFDCGDANIGDPCNDNNVCTINDVVQSDCSCAGTPAVDSDNDGTCDALDQCSGGPEPGSPCDDGNVNTYNDIVNNSCNCQGELIPSSAQIDIQIEENNDDAEEKLTTGSVSLNSTDLELGYELSIPQLVGLRFTNIIVPQGADIVDAYIQFALDEESTDVSSLIIRGEDVDDAPAFINAAFNLSSRDLTDDSVIWSPPSWDAGEKDGPDQRTINIAKVVQEIVDRPGWTPQNNMAFLISGSGTRTAESFEGSPAYAAVLHIEYNSVVDCPSMGVACDDNDPCTENDVVDSACNCAGVLRDADNDGVCDDNDLCPGGNDNVDTDADGIPDYCDSCDNNLIGAPCDDGDPNTENDVYDANCNCSGTAGGLFVLDLPITLGSDDVEQRESDGAVYLFSSDLELVNDRSRGNQIIGLRFNNVSIPSGASIQSAYIQFTADEISTDPVSLRIEGEDTDNALSFVNSDYNVSTRPRTNASINWSPPAWNTIGERGAAQRTIDISSIVQEIVDRSGWNNGGSVAIIITGSGKRTAEAYDGVSAESPALHIEYTQEGGGSCPTAGQACDDGDSCTINDVFDSNCNCAGVYQDADGDGYCIGLDPNDADECVPDSSQDPACNPDPEPCSLLFADDFENGWGNWNRGGSDSHLSTDFARSGMYSLRIRDNSGAASSVFTNSMNLSAYQSVEISFSYYPNSMDNPDEDFWLQISTNGGNTYFTVEEWNLSDEFVNGRWYQDQVTISDFGFSSNTRFRFVCDASTNLDQVYIDDVSIRVCNASIGAAKSKRLANPKDTLPAALSMKQSDFKESLQNISSIPASLKVEAIPNPFQHEFYVFIHRPTTLMQEAQLRIVDVNGRIIYQKSRFPLSQNYLIVPQREWPEGVYFLQVQTGKYMETLKLVKQSR